MPNTQNKSNEVVEYRYDKLSKDPLHTLKNSKEVIEKIRQGQVKEFEYLYLQYCEPLVLFANRYVDDLEIAENVVQDVFLNVWKKREALDPTGNIKTYLYTSVKNYALNSIDRRRREKQYQEYITIEDINFDTPELQLMRDEIIEIVNSVVQNLPERCRMIFLMSRSDHLSYAEIAEVLGLSVKTVENQMGKALKILRKHLSHLI